MSGSASRASSPAGGRIRSGHVPNPFAAPYLVAVEHGFFADEGIELDDRRVPNGSVVADALASGELDIGTGGHLQTAAAVAAGSDQAFIAPLGFERAPDHLCITIVARRDRAHDLEGLRGKTIAVSAQGAISELQLRLALGGPTRTIAVPFSRMRDALASGEADAASIVEPFASALVRDPAFAVLDRGSLSRALPSGARVLIVGLVARRSWVAEHPSLAAGAVRALQRAVKAMAADGSLARRAVARVTTTDTGDVTMPLFDAALGPTDLQLAFDLGHENGVLARWIDARETIADAQ